MAKILIAEDDRDIRELITFTLNYAGYQVIAAADGEEAVQAAHVEQPDLILLDDRMPRMSGVDACIAMKKDPLLAKIPIVFLSGRGPEVLAALKTETGAAAYIEKPFDPGALMEQVAALLATK